jgi:hypothetical protein
MSEPVAPATPYLHVPPPQPPINKLLVAVALLLAVAGVVVAAAVSIPFGGALIFLASAAAVFTLKGQTPAE